MVLQYREVPEVVRQWRVVRVGQALRERRGACGCRCVCGRHDVRGPGTGTGTVIVKVVGPVFCYLFII